MDPKIKAQTDEEKQIFELIQKGITEDIKHVLINEKVRINCVDDHGMTLLEHSAYRGNYELCKLLLDCGADVNSHYHDSGYTALMFGSLSGKLDVVSLLLEHGASTTIVNSVGRTASQMAAFVGNHEVVSIINNFIPKEEIDYYTEAHGLEKEPKMPPTLANDLHQFVIKTNIHPVRLALFFQKNKLLNESKKVINVLELLCEKEIKQNGNELLSLKFHHLAFVTKACDKFLKTLKEKVNMNNPGVLEPLIKRWIKGRDSDGFPEVLEKFLRQSVREYPYVECSLFQQLVRTLAPVEVGNEPSAVSILSQTVSGQRGIDDGATCLTCGEPKAEKRCSACKSVQYCDKICQKLHWFTHKVHCAALALSYKKQQSEQDVSPDKDDNCNSKAVDCSKNDETKIDEC